MTGEDNKGEEKYLVEIHILENTWYVRWAYVGAGPILNVARLLAQRSKCPYESTPCVFGFCACVSASYFFSLGGVQDLFSIKEAKASSITQKIMMELMMKMMSEVFIHDCRMCDIERCAISRGRIK